jgi:hypothetical protein
MFKSFADYRVNVCSIKNLKISFFDPYVSYQYKYSYKLISFNHDYLYLIIPNNRLGYNKIFILDRIFKNANKFIDIDIENSSGLDLIKFDMSSCIYYLDANKKLIHVYESKDASLLYAIPLLDAYKSLSFSILDTILFNQNVNCKFIEYDEY